MHCTVTTAVVRITSWLRHCHLRRVWATCRLWEKQESEQLLLEVSCWTLISSNVWMCRSARLWCGSAVALCAVFVIHGHRVAGTSLAECVTGVVFQTFWNCEQQEERTRCLLKAVFEVYWQFSCFSDRVLDAWAVLLVRAGLGQGNKGRQCTDTVSVQVLNLRNCKIFVVWQGIWLNFHRLVYFACEQAWVSHAPFVLHWPLSELLQIQHLKPPMTSVGGLKPRVFLRHGIFCVVVSRLCWPESDDFQAFQIWAYGKNQF